MAEKNRTYRKNRIGCLPILGGILIVGWLLSQALPKTAWGMFFAVVACVLAYQYSEREDDRRRKEFEEKHPAPRLDITEPKPPEYQEVAHRILPPQSVDILDRASRVAILERDSYCCQVCGNEKATQELEVHHVMPRAQQGFDHPTNLATLCLYCHDREDWYGHVRKNPTTIPKKDFIVRRWI